MSNDDKIFVKSTLLTILNITPSIYWVFKFCSFRLTNIIDFIVVFAPITGVAVLYWLFLFHSYDYYYHWKEEIVKYKKFERDSFVDNLCADLMGGEIKHYEIPRKVLFRYGLADDFIEKSLTIGVFCLFIPHTIVLLIVVIIHLKKLEIL